MGESLARRSRQRHRDLRAALQRLVRECSAVVLQTVAQWPFAEEAPGAVAAVRYRRAAQLQEEAELAALRVAPLARERQLPAATAEFYVGEEVAGAE